MSDDPSKSIIFVVVNVPTVEMMEQSVNSLKQQQIVHDSNVKVVTFSEFEKTRCFQEIKGTRLEGNYTRVKDGSDKTPCSLPDACPDEQAIFVGDPKNKRALLHEFLHCVAVKTTTGKELRKYYGVVVPDLDRVINSPVSRSLAEQVILAPEDCWVERQIIEFAASSDGELNVSAKQYLQNAFQGMSGSLDTVAKGDFSSDWWKRTQAALLRFRSSLFCLCMSGTARVHDPRLEIQFQRLSEKFANSSTLSNVSIVKLWSLAHNSSLKGWVDESSGAVKDVFEKAKA